MIEQATKPAPTPAPRHLFPLALHGLILRQRFEAAARADSAALKVRLAATASPTL